MKKDLKNIGGQAVIEGAMMKSARGWTVAVRDPKGEIQVKKEPLSAPGRFIKMPVVRGISALYYAMSLGIRALGFSATIAAAEEDKAPEKQPGGAAIALTMAASLILGAGLFIALPLYATKLIGAVIPDVGEKSLLFNLVDGIIRVLIFLLYVVLIGLWKDIRRVFEYHGAEHMVIHAYEESGRLDMDEIKRMSPLHPRCGTSFLLIVMLISILVFSFIPQSWAFSYKLLSRLTLIPLIAGLSYETLKASASMKDNPVMRLLILPGLLLQRLTTRPPDEGQIRVAVKALEEVLSMEAEDAR